MKREDFKIGKLYRYNGETLKFVSYGMGFGLRFEVLGTTYNNAPVYAAIHTDEELAKVQEVK